MLKSMAAWQALQKGDLIDIIAPASRFSEKELWAGVEQMEEWGLRVRVPKSLFSPHFLHAAPDSERLKQLVQALKAPDSRAIWCGRGGYGSLKLLPALSKIKRALPPKLFIGLSDVTSLHLFLNQKWNWSTLHAPVLTRMGARNLPKSTLKELHDIVFGEQKIIEFKKLKPMNDRAKKLKRAQGSIIGGNLTILQTTLGTPFHIQGEGHFIFLEDVAERGYRIDRMIEHLKQAGVFKNARGILLGDFTEGHEPDGRNMIPLVLRSCADDLNLPVFSGIDSGHGAIQRAVPFCTKAVLSQHAGSKPQYNLRVEAGFQC